MVAFRVFLFRNSLGFFSPTNYVTSRPPVSLMATVKVQQCSIGILQVGLHAFSYFHWKNNFTLVYYTQKLMKLSYEKTPTKRIMYIWCLHKMYILYHLLWISKYISTLDTTLRTRTQLLIVFSLRYTVHDYWHFERARMLPARVTSYMRICICTSHLQ